MDFLYSIHHINGLFSFTKYVFSIGTYQGEYFEQLMFPLKTIEDTIIFAIDEKYHLLDKTVSYIEIEGLKYIKDYSGKLKQYIENNLEQKYSEVKQRRDNDEALKALQAELATLTDKSPEQLKPLLQGKQTDPTMAKIKKIINDIKSQQMRIAKKENFFSNLALMPGAEELVNYAIEKVGSENVYILTAPIEGSATCEPEKRDWIKTNFPSVNIGNFICNASKADHAASNHVLIDDNRKYIDPWVAAGGIGIFHTNPANSDKQLKDILNRRTESEKNTMSETYNVKRWQTIAGIITD
jgi:5'(3')-deoxyribonucleotidase